MPWVDGGTPLPSGGSPDPNMTYPDEALQWGRVQVALSEGEIGGLVNGLQSVFLDGTPVLDSGGNFNFTGLSVAHTRGTQTQGVIPAFEQSESEVTIGVEVTHAATVTRTINPTGLSAVRVKIGIPQLKMIRPTDGVESLGTVQVTIERKLTSEPVGSYVAIPLAKNGVIKGKYASEIVIGYRVELPGTGPWDIRITRVTPDYVKVNETDWIKYDKTYLNGYTEITDARLRYPNTALLALLVSAKQFPNLPAVHSECYGVKVSVPANYTPASQNPTTKVWTAAAYATTGVGTTGGTWDGTFKTLWTSNPAWLFYHLATQPRYGAGNYLQATGIDKWALYNISQVCDQMVDSGIAYPANLEPRFTCSLHLQAQEEAIKVLAHLASAFRGMLYSAAGLVVPVQDVDQAPVALFTKANVLNGKFSYQGTARAARHTAALVSWIDPTAGYSKAIEYVEDAANITRFGLQVVSQEAIGCTSQAQAQRYGNWILATEQLETETVTFGAGLDASTVLPGDVIQVQDNDRAGSSRMGGRVVSATTTAVTLDAPVTLGAGTYYLRCRLSTGVTESKTVSNSAGTYTTLNVSSAFSSAPPAQGLWICNNLAGIKLYRVVSIRETDALNYAITALLHDPSKYSDQVNLTTPSVTQSLTLTAPTVTLTTSTRTYQNHIASVLSASWPPLDDATSYAAEYSLAYGPWQTMRVSGACAEAVDVTPGDYRVRVVALYSAGRKSLYFEQSATVADPTALPPGIQTIDDAATSAAAAAAAAQDGVNTINDPDTLSLNEKPQILQDYAALVAEHAQLVADATTYSVSHSAYDAAYTALVETYLGGSDFIGGTIASTPVGWHTTTGNTALGAGKRASEWDPKWLAVRSASNDLKSAIASGAFAKGLDVEITADLASVSALFAERAVHTNLPWRQTWDDYRDADWTSGGGVATITTPLGGSTGGKVLRIAGYKNLYWGSNIAFDPNRTYKVRVRYRQITDPTSGGKLFYAGLKQYAEDGTTDLGNCYAALTGSVYAMNVAGDGWHEYTGYWKGTAAAASYGSADPTTPGHLLTTCKYVRPLLLVNYSTGVGAVAEVDFLEFTDATDELALANALAATAVAQDARAAAPEVVATLPTLPNATYYIGKQVFLTTNGKLYRNKAGVWNKDVDAPDLTGTLDAARIASGALDITKLSSGLRPPRTVGALPATPFTGYLAGDTVVLTTDNKLYRFTGTTWTVSVDGADITADSITAAQIAANAVTANELAANSVTATKILAGSVTTSHMTAGTIDGDRLIVGSIDADRITANSITAGQIGVGAIGTDQLAAKAITSDKMVVANSENLVADSNLAFGDLRQYTPYGNTTKVSIMGSYIAPTANILKLDTTGVAVNSVTAVWSGVNPYSHSSDEGFAVVPGDKYYLSLNACKDASFNGLLRAYLFCETDVPGSPRTQAWSSSGGVFAPTSAAYTTMGMEVTVPANAVRGFIYVQAAAPSTGTPTGAVYVTKISCIRKAGSVLIEDGAVTLDHLNFVPATDQNVIATINATTEGALRIAASKIQISGTTTFSAGYSPSDVAGAATFTVQGWYGHASDLTQIDGGRIYTKSIMADAIAAKQIYTSHLTVTNSENLIADSNLALGNLSQYKLQGSPANISLVAVSGAPTPKVIKMNTAGLAASAIISFFTGVNPYVLGSQEGFPVVPGDKYLVSVSAYRDSTFAGTLAIYLWCESCISGVLGWVSQQIAIPATNGGFVTYEGTMTVPANAQRAFLYVYGIAAASAPTGSVYVTKLSAIRKVDADLIVDGTLQALINMSDLTLTNELKSLGAAGYGTYVAGTGTTPPVGFKLSGTRFTSYFLDGTNDPDCVCELGGSVNINGYKAAVVTDRVMNNYKEFLSTGTWTCPVGVTSIELTIVGAGAGGVKYTGGDGGGGGGQALRLKVTVVPGTTYTLTIGTGGTGSTTGVGNAGGNSTMTGSGFATITALGGNAPAHTTGGTGGGGTAPGVSTTAVAGFKSVLTANGGGGGTAAAAGGGVTGGGLAGQAPGGGGASGWGYGAGGNVSISGDSATANSGGGGGGTATGTVGGNGGSGYASIRF